MYAVMFYVTLNKRKRLGDCVTFSYLSGRAAHTVMFRYMPAMHHAVKCQGAASYHAFSQRVHAGCQFSPTSSWCGLGSCGSTTGTIFRIYPALMYAVMFYVILNKCKRLGDCVTFLYISGRCTYRNVSKYEKDACAFSMHHAVKCHGAASYHAFSQRVHAGCQFSPTSSWCGPGSMFHAPLISWIAPARQKCNLRNLICLQRQCVLLDINISVLD